MKHIMILFFLLSSQKAISLTQEDLAKIMAVQGARIKMLEEKIVDLGSTIDQSVLCNKGKVCSGTFQPEYIPQEGHPQVELDGKLTWQRIGNIVTINGNLFWRGGQQNTVHTANLSVPIPPKTTGKCAGVLSSASPERIIPSSTWVHHEIKEYPCKLHWTSANGGQADLFISISYDISM